jgi:hypothetical protein
LNLLDILRKKTKDLMEQKIENSDKKKSKKKRIILLLILLLFFLIPASLFLVRDTRIGKIFFGDNDVDKNVSENSNERDTQEENKVDEVIEESDPKAEVAESEKEEMVSENYRVSQVKFGGNVVIENGKSRDTKLEIYQVKSETIISQEDEEPRILISWKTNKESIAVVNYSKSDGKGVVNASEDGYGFDHTMLLKNMEFSMIYTYKIEAKDKWGNKVDTEYFSAYTGDKSESIFDLITNAVEDVFG